MLEQEGIMAAGKAFQALIPEAKEKQTRALNPGPPTFKELPIPTDQPVVELCLIKSWKMPGLHIPSFKFLPS